MNTSYFGNIKNVKNPLAICGKSPEWYVGPEHKKLAPKWSFFKDYKDGKIDKNGYIEKYNELVLSQLDPKRVYEYLVNTYGEDVTLLCWEKPGEFCHRRLIAEWLEENLKINIPEL